MAPSPIDPALQRAARQTVLLAFVGGVLFTAPFLVELEGLAKAVTLTVGALVLAVASTSTLRLRAKLAEASSTRR